MKLSKNEKGKTVQTQEEVRGTENNNRENKTHS